MTTGSNLISLMVMAFSGIFLMQGCSAMSPESPPAKNVAGEFTNTYWKLERLNGVPVEIGAAGKELFVQFRKENSQVRGFSGCNTFTGTYKADNGKISIGPVAMTRKMCFSAMDQESAFHKAINSFALYRVDGERLTIEDNKGNIVARFESRSMQ